MFNFYHEVRVNSTKSTCHSSGVREYPRTSLSINISLLAELWVSRAIAFVEWATSVQNSGTKLEKFSKVVIAARA